MRPVNLIPVEERPGGRKPLRSGPVAYILIGALAAAVIAVTALVVVDGKVSTRKTEVARLEAQQASIEAKANSLSPYIQFTTVREQRLATVASLADSRFDWERVLAELSLVIPADVQITSLDGSASASAGIGGGISMRGEIPGPALELVGCAPSQKAVAAFIEAIKNIDGVTRVGVPTSSLESGGEGGGASASTCTAGKHTASFQMVAGFDAAPVPPAETSEEIAPEAAPTESSSTESSSTESSSSGSEEGTTS